MDDKNSEYKYKTFEETASKPLIPYAAIDCFGKKITVQPKIPGRHESDHKLEKHPIVFFNLDSILLNPDTFEESSSQNPIAIKNREKGKILLFHKKGFVQALNFPNFCTGNEKMTVCVLYEDPTKNPNPKNYTLTYRLSFEYNE